jgi:hypothetical protein
MKRSTCFVAILILFAALLCADLSPAKQARAARPTVPGLHELVVIEPQVHERGLPAARLVPADCGDLAVDIPPAVHVHRYYFNGVKQFQGPIIQGGPTIVVARHPVSNQKMYVDTSLPPGAPKIIHDASSITYLYPDQRVILKFAKRHSCSVVVEYARGRGLARRCQELHQSVKEAAGRALKRSPLVESIKQSAAGGRELIAGAAGGAQTAFARMIDSARQAAGMLPGVESLRSYGEDSPVRRELESLRAAGARKTRSLTPDFPTNR